jgi:hypothetical protein
MQQLKNIGLAAVLVSLLNNAFAIECNIEGETQGFQKKYIDAANERSGRIKSLAESEVKKLESLTENPGLSGVLSLLSKNANAKAYNPNASGNIVPAPYSPPATQQQMPAPAYKPPQRGVNPLFNPSSHSNKWQETVAKGSI